MGKLSTLLNQRLKKANSSSKMAALAKQSASGNLTSFSGIFSISELSAAEKKNIENILQEYGTGKEDFQADLRSLIAITSEVKAINNQAAILHGERIKKAQTVFKSYQDGAFSAWLVAAYGNRQTPYNFLQYYEFYQAMPKVLRTQVEAMPRQAIYTLASREGDLKAKQGIVESYKGQTKEELLKHIREAFPLAITDKRRQNMGEVLIQGLQRLRKGVKREFLSLTKKQKTVVRELLDELYSFTD